MIEQAVHERFSGLEMPMIRNSIHVIIILTLLFAGCASVQYTDRRRLLLISEEDEIALGEEAFQQVLAESELSQNEKWNRIIRRVGKRIAKAADKPQYKWEFILIEAPDTVNAFALPGGKVAFYTGILAICEDEAGVAVVMGHEIAHVLARHGGERISQGMVAGLIGGALQMAVKNRTPEAQEGILAGYGFAAQVGVLLPFSREHEREADYIGQILMARAGYHPGEAVDFWERMNALSGSGEIPEFLSTHPSDEKRVEVLKSNLTEALTYYEKR